jgi:hypothetical protein
MADCKELH